MRKVQLIEYSIIVIGLIFGYQFITGFLKVIIQITYNFIGSPEGFRTILIPSLLTALIYAISFVVLIRKSKQIAAFLNKGLTNDFAHLKIDTKSLLRIVLIGISFITVLSNIPYFIVLGIELINSPGIDNVEYEGAMEDSYNDPFYTFEFYSPLIQIIVSLIILCFSNRISGWFIRKKDQEAIVFESGEEKI